MKNQRHYPNTISKIWPRIPSWVLARDLVVQKKPGVDYPRYWLGETSGKVFCLLEAPSKEAAIVVYREAHGLAANEIVEVKLSS